MSCQHLNINPNIKLLLSYWSTFKFGLILTRWRARKTWLFFTYEFECEIINILTPLYTWNWGCPWRPWQSEFFIIFSPQCACGSTFTLGTFRNVVALCKGKKSWMSLHKVMYAHKHSKTAGLQMVFCYRNCSDLLWEKIVLMIENMFRTLKGQYNFWNLSFWGFSDLINWNIYHSNWK